MKCLPSRTAGPFALVSSCQYVLVTLLGLYACGAVAQTVIAWGDNLSGQCTVPASASNVVAVAAGWNHSLALRRDGTVVCWGAVSNVPSSATAVTRIAAGASHNLALRADGGVVAWGDNKYGQTSVPPWATNIVDMAAGSYHSVALRADGTLVAWGYNSYGQTNTPPKFTNIVAIAASDDQTMAKLADGRIALWGAPPSRTPWPPYSLLPPTFLFSSVKDVTTLSSGVNEQSALTSRGEVFTWAYYPRTKASVPPLATNLVLVATGTNFHLAVRADGQLVAWGKNSLTNVPPQATNVIAIAAGGAHCLAVLADATPPRLVGPTAYSTKIAVGSPLPLSGPAVGSQPLTYQWMADGVPIPGADGPYPRLPAALGTEKVKYQVIVSNGFGWATGAVATIAVQPVNAWGDALDGQCDVPNSLLNPRSVAAGAFHCLALNADGTITAWGKNRDGQTSVPATATNLIAVGAGGDHSLALRTDGTVIGWGRNWDGQATAPATATNVVAISAGWAHSLALRADGTVAAWGNDDYGQTEVPPLATEVIAIAAGYYHNLALRSDGTVVTWGLDVPIPPGATNLVQIASGWKHCLALRVDGSILAWGDNSYGQCSVPPSATNVVALAAGYYQSMALRADGAVVVWGRGFRNSFSDVPIGATFVSIAAGEDFNVALSSSEPPRFSALPRSIEVVAGGSAVLTADVVGRYPLSFQWYRGSTPIDGATNRYLVLSQAQSGDAGTYVLVASNEVDQVAGPPIQLNLRFAPVITTATEFKSVVIGSSFCLSADVSGAGSLTYQWQLNGADLVDDGRISGAASPVLCVDNSGYGDSGDYSLTVSSAYGSATGLVAEVSISPILAWGDNSAGQLAVPIGTSNVVAVSAGGNHSLALIVDGSAIAWGDDCSGQLDVPSPATNLIAIAAGQAHSLALRSDGIPVAWGDNSYGQTNVPPGASNVIAIAAGKSHNLALLMGGNVVAWGANSRGEINVPDSATNVVAIAAGESESMALQADGTVVVWGYNPSCYCGNRILARGAVAIASGGNHQLVLGADGVLRGWGGNYYGQATAPASATNLTRIAAGWDHNLGLQADGTVVAWGADYSGQSSVPFWATNAVAISAGGAHSLALVSDGTLPFMAALVAPACDGTGFRVTVPTQSGRVYTLEYKNSPQDPTWIALPLVPGLGAPTSLTDPTATEGQRFYRVLQW